MDPVLIDPLTALASVSGIVTLTIALVHLLKRTLGDTPYLSAAPVWLYAVLVAGALTYLSNVVLKLLPGELPLLLTQAVLSALLASGALEFARAWNKPLSETQVAQAARESRTNPGGGN